VKLLFRRHDAWSGKVAWPAGRAPQPHNRQHGECQQQRVAQRDNGGTGGRAVKTEVIEEERVFRLRKPGNEQ
jgi:hypothetical protein